MKSVKLIYCTILVIILGAFLKGNANDSYSFIASLRSNEIVFDKNDSTDKIKMELWYVVESVLSDSSAQLDEKSKVMLNQLIDDGIKKLQRDKFSTVSIENAKTNLKIFITKLVILQNEKGHTMGKVKVTKSTFNNAKSSLCPLYPFCT